MNRAKMRAKLAKRQGGWFCHWCKGLAVEDDAAGEHRATVDHLIPLSRGGRDDMLNAVLACQGCNGERGAPETSPTEAAAEWAAAHAAPPWSTPKRRAVRPEWRREARQPATHRMDLSRVQPR
jgi:hypothetical protein